MLTRYSIEIIRLLESEGHPTSYFAGLVGCYIPPEVAYRSISKIRRSDNLILGLNAVVNKWLGDMYNKNRVSKVQINGMNYWAIKDLEWQIKILEKK